MSREFSTSEIIRQKCSICGIKNKIYTELIYNGKYCGYKLTCCNCGHVDTFIIDDDQIASHVYTKGREVCIHLTICKNKRCPYYGKYPIWTAATTIENILNGLPTDGENSGNNNGNNTGNNGTNCEICMNKNSNDIQLDINRYEFDRPKYH